MEPGINVLSMEVMVITTLKPMISCVYLFGTRDESLPSFFPIPSL